MDKRYRSCPRRHEGEPGVRPSRDGAQPSPPGAANGLRVSERSTGKIAGGMEMEKQTVELALGRETKGTFRYEETEGGKPPVIGTLYVKKYAVGHEPPQRIRVTIEPA